MVDYHVHLKGDLTLEQRSRVAARRHSVRIAVNCGKASRSEPWSHRL
jgi:hypothetical protein